MPEIGSPAASRWLATSIYTVISPAWSSIKRKRNEFLGNVTVIHLGKIPFHLFNLYSRSHSNPFILRAKVKVLKKQLAIIYIIYQQTSLKIIHRACSIVKASFILCCRKYSHCPSSCFLYAPLFSFQMWLNELQYGGFPD